ncbi:C40 family peptidase [Thalassiella azotivora]
MSTRTVGRHRASARPKTPLSTISAAVTSNAGVVGRRSAVIAASSGLVVTIGLPAADAAPVTERADSAPTAPAQPETSAPTSADGLVSVPADAPVSFTAEPLTEATPPPPPPPPPVVQEASESRSSERASRTTERESLPTADVAPSEVGAAVLEIAARYVGTPYRYGGTTPSGFDCSGFTQYVYAQVGINLPRTSGAQADFGRRVSASEARPGDLVWTEGHIGIYAGGNMMYDAPRTGKSVSKREIWYTPTFIRVTG